MKVTPKKSNLNQMLERDSEGKLIHWNDIHVILSGSKITPDKITVQCFHSERGDETIEDVQYIIDTLISNKTIEIKSVYYTELTLSFGSYGDEYQSNLDIWFYTELSEDDTPVIEMTEEFMNSIIRPK